MKYLVVHCLLLCLAMPLAATNVFERQLPLENNQANELFAQQQYEEALKSYLDLYGQDTKNGALAYNIGNTYTMMGDLEKASEFFQKAISSENGQAGDRARFNLGNLAMASQQPQEAVKQYIDYLQRNPDDLDAKRNLELALRQMEQQQQQQQQDQQNQDENEENQDQQDQSQQQNQQQEQQNQENEDQQNQSEDQQNQEQNQQQEQNQENQNEGEQPEEQQQQQQAQAEEKELDESMKEQILQALREQEMQQQKEYQKRKAGGPKRRAKDW